MYAIVTQHGEITWCDPDPEVCARYLTMAARSAPDKYHGATVEKLYHAGQMSVVESELHRAKERLNKEAYVMRKIKRLIRTCPDTDAEALLTMVSNICHDYLSGRKVKGDVCSTPE